jgi:hypothetical protein
MEQEEQQKKIHTEQKELAEAIKNLQSDIIEQDSVNKTQQAKIEHYERIMADLIGRVAALEDKDNTEEQSNKRTTRSQATTDPQIEEQLQKLTKT